MIDKFLTDEECDNYISLIEEKTKDVCVPFTNNTTNFNHKYVDNELAQIFYDKLVNGPLDSTRANDLIMMSKYVEGEKFGLHTDTGLFYDSKSKTKSRYTMLIYLNDNFDGGSTVFYNNNFVITDTVVPKRGSCLIFDIDLWHEGQPISNGIKYWIGCEIIGSFELL